MKIFKRDIQEKIENLLFKGNMIVILGPRQSGKTTLSKKLIESYGNTAKYFDCQIAEVRKHFVFGEPDILKELIGDKKIVVFDEAQTIQDIGSILKIFHDTYPNAQIIATGSSSFDLANKINEPMTGRIFEFILLPLSLNEISREIPLNKEMLNELIEYGSYPAVVAAESKLEKLETLKNLATNYLYKDIFVFESIRNPRIFEQLVKLLAYQIGNMVSVNEIAKNIGISRSVVLRYLRLLEQSFIIKIIHSFSNNPRNEIKKAFKVYFYDTGVRNALVDTKTLLENRQDKGALWENYYITERLKFNTLESFPSEIMFWRTRIGTEIDVIEKNGENIFATECKWNYTDVVFSEFLKKYPHAKTNVITPKKYLEQIKK